MQKNINIANRNTPNHVFVSKIMNIFTPNFQNNIHLLIINIKEK